MGAIWLQEHDGTHKKDNKRHQWFCRSFLGPCDRTNVPGHHVLQTIKKHVRNTPDGCLWVIIHRYGGNQKQDKRGNKWSIKTCFITHAQDKKNEELINEGNGCQEILWERIMGQQNKCSLPKKMILCLFPTPLIHELKSTLSTSNTTSILISHTHPSPHQTRP